MGENLAYRAFSATPPIGENSAIFVFLATGPGAAPARS